MPPGIPLCPKIRTIRRKCRKGIPLCPKIRTIRRKLLWPGLKAD